MACLAPLLFVVRQAAGSDHLNVTLLVEPGQGNQEIYGKALLELALAKAGVDGKVSAARYPSAQLSATQLVLTQPEHYVMLAGTSLELEERLLPVRVPIYLGLGSGYRIMLIRKARQAALDKVQSLKDLQAFSVGQGEKWSDVSILENAGLSVVRAQRYRELFPMLVWGQFDLFSRGLFEVYPEYETYREEYPTLAVERHLVVVYPFAIYFFVSPKQPQLRDVLQQGLEAAYASGEMQDLLLSQPNLSDALKRAQLDERLRIDLPAYGLSHETMRAIEAHPFVIGKEKGQPPHP